MIDLKHLDKLEEKDFQSTELVDCIFEVEDKVERQSIISQCSKIAKSFGVKGVFREMIQAAKDRINDTKREIAAAQKAKDKEAKEKALTEVQNNIWMAPDGLLYNTGKWSVSDGGILCADGFSITVAAYYPIFISERTSTIENNNEQVRLTWVKEGRVRSWLASRDQISDAKKIVGLSKYGLPVTSETARNLVAYLNEFEKYNPDIPTTMSTGRFGWIGLEGKALEFIPYYDGVAFEDVGMSDLVRSVRAKGDESVWLNMMKQIRANKRQEPLVYLAGSFASPLLPVLNVLPFIVNLYGVTGAGKTVALMVAASVWADPSEHAYISESNSTVNAITKKLGVLNHLPLMLDDLSKIRDADKRKFTELIYNICAGSGKGRLTRNIEMRDVEKWANVTLTNLERPLTDETMQGGAINRVLDFEISEGDIFEDGNAIVTVLSQHFGHGGEKWVNIIKEYGAEKIRDIYLDYVQKLRGMASDTATLKEQKQIMAAAVLLTADLITEREIFKDGKRLDFMYVFDAIKDVKTTSEMERAYLFTSDYVMQQQQYFKPGPYGDYAGPVWGAFLDDDWTAINPVAMDKIAEAGNFDRRQFVKWMDKNGLLQTKDKRHSTKLVRIRGLEKAMRTYVMKLGIEDGETKGNPVDIAEILNFTPADDLDEIPFVKP